MPQYFNVFIEASDEASYRSACQNNGKQFIDQPLSRFLKDA